MIEFRKVIQSSTYLNPFEEFEPRQGEVEIRWDPLTNLTARVVRFPTRRLNRLDPKPAIASSVASKCPFCEENMDPMTARLDKALFGCERMTRGDVTVIPNLISFDKYSLVAIVSHEHYLSMRDLAEKGSLVKGILALIEAFRCIRESDPEARYSRSTATTCPRPAGALSIPMSRASQGNGQPITRGS